MAIYQYPNDSKVYLQNNRTNIYPIGNIWGTFAIDLETNVGAIRVSPRLMINVQTSDLANLGCPVAFKYFDTRIWAIAGSRMFYNSGTADAAFSEDSSTGAQTDYSSDESDMEVFNDALCAFTTDGLFSKPSNGAGTGSWTQRDTLSGGSPHVTTYFRKFNRLYYSNLETRIISIDTAWVTADPGSDYGLQLISGRDFISCITSTSDDVWIGCINRLNYGGRGSVYRWDGISAQPTKEYLLQAQGAMAFTVLDDTPYVMDSNGILSMFTGYSFKEVARLPFGNKLPYNVDDSDNERFIHPNGMFPTKNHTIRMVINNRANNGNVIENMPSGIWEWSEEKGLVHIQPFTYTVRQTTTITDFGQNRIARVGALASMQIPSTSNVDGTMLVGATVYTNASSTTNAIFFDNSIDTIQKKGYDVSDWIESSSIKSEWERIWNTYRKFLDSGDKVVFKYRNTEEAPTYFDITWVDTTHFTTTQDLSAYAPGAAGFNAGFGGEVEILRGTGSGSCAHITEISGAGTFTVTIDTAITGVTTGTASARAQKWVKVLPEITITPDANNFTDSGANLPIDGGANARVQIKRCMTLTGAGEMYRYKVSSKPIIKIE